MKYIALAFLGIAASVQGAAAEFKFGSQTIKVPDGFEVELVAGPPLVDRPIAADFDDQGRLYVSDSSGSNDKPELQLQQKPHRVVRLEDTDGDGKFDKSVVFADHMMFPEGAMWLDGSFYVGAPPSIWKLTDTDGDGVADQRQEWMQAKTLTGCANDLHGPYAGPDGWIYWAKGAFAKQTWERPGRDPFVTRAAHIFRCRPDGSGVEPVMTGGMDNPVEVVFTPTGERIFSSTFLEHPHAGLRDGLVHAIYGGVYGKVHDVIDDHPQTGEVLPILTHLGAAAPCGLARYESSIFAVDFQDNLFACCFNLHKVIRTVLTPDGASFKATNSDFVSSDDTDFHPTDVIEDADGSILVLNTGGWYKLCCPTSQLAKPDVLGLIYRIRRTGAPKVEDPRGLRIAWTSISNEELVKLLGDGRPAVRKRSVTLLGKRGVAAIGPLARALGPTFPVEVRRQALWALIRIDAEQARATARVALHDSDPSVRHVALYDVSLWRDPAGLGAAVTLLGDPDLGVRRIAAEALGRIGKDQAVDALIKASETLGSADRILEHSLTFALIEIAAPEATSHGLQASSARTRRVALIALDQMPHGGLKPEQVTPLLRDKDELIRETARWIVSRHDNWGEALAGFLGERLKEGAVTDSALDLENQLAQMAQAPGIQELLASAVNDSKLPKESRGVALRAMARASGSDTPPAWIKAVTECLGGSDAALLRASVAAARSFTLPKSGSPELERALQRVGQDEQAAADIRIEALAAAQPLREMSPNLFAFILDFVHPEKPVTVRNSAATVISRAKLKREQLLVLSDALENVGPFELPKLVGAFEGADDEAVGNKLIDNLKSAKALGSLRPEVLKPQLAKFPASVQTKAEALLALMDADAAKQKQHIDELLPELKTGDVRCGQSIFNSTKAACFTCHAIGYLGGHVGPDLTSIGTIRTERDLLESIVYPSASFVRSFEPVIVETKSGDQHSGILKKDSADEVVLVTGPDAEVHLARANIAEMRPGAVSVMPQGLDQQLSKQELADLLAFLKNTRWGR